MSRDGSFEAFVLFAEMRTGSNHLEEMMNSVPGVTSFGELFNPTFIGHPNQDEVLGFNLMTREADPLALFEAVRSFQPDLPGFRFFHDHDPRVLARILPDPRIAKVILKRNPLDSYISRKIAGATGQWKLTDLRNRRESKVRFDETEFLSLLDSWRAFQKRLQSELQRTGQTAFQIEYDDLGRAEVLNGLLKFLGVDGQIDPGASRLKRQNPSDVDEKVENWDDLRASLAKIDPFSLDHLSHDTVDRAPGVPRFAATASGELLFLPVPGSFVDETRAWLEDTSGPIVDGMNQRDLRKWMLNFPQHRKFTVLRHPLARAHFAFCRDVLPPKRPRTATMRRLLRNRYNVPLPKEGPGKDYTLDQHRAAFLAWLHFLKGCLSGQTAIRPLLLWVPQHDALQAMAKVALPDLIVREGDQRALDGVRGISGCDKPKLQLSREDVPFTLAQVHTGEVEKAAEAVYRKDYTAFGFTMWSAS